MPHLTLGGSTCSVYSAVSTESALARKRFKSNAVTYSTFLLVPENASRIPTGMQLGRCNSLRVAPGVLIQRYRGRDVSVEAADEAQLRDD